MIDKSLIYFHAKTKISAKNVHEWPAKCENHECFLLCDFPLYGSI